MTKKLQLLQWIQSHGVVRTHEVIQWGLDHYSNRADRDARALAHAGQLRRLTDDEKVHRFGQIREDAWATTQQIKTSERQLTLADYLDR